MKNMGSLYLSPGEDTLAIEPGILESFDLDFVICLAGCDGGCTYIFAGPTESGCERRCAVIRLHFSGPYIPNNPVIHLFTLC